MHLEVADLSPEQADPLLQSSCVSRRIFSWVNALYCSPSPTAQAAGFSPLPLLPLLCRLCCAQKWITLVFLGHKATSVPEQENFLYFLHADYALGCCL